MEIKLKENNYCCCFFFFIENVENLIIFINNIRCLDMPLKIRIKTNYFCINNICYSEILDYGFNKFDLI
jgi:hypothetical protein